jgi:subtilisin family serine protease
LPTEQFILLPRRGLHAPAGSPAHALLTNLPHAVSTAAAVDATFELAPQSDFRVIDTLAETGAKLVEMDEAAAAAAKAPGSPVRALPVVIYKLPDPSVHVLAAASVAPSTTFTVECVEAGTGKSLSGAKVAAFDNFKAMTGAIGTTDALGRVSLSLPGNTIDRLYVVTKETHWGAFRAGIQIAPGTLLRIDIEPVVLTYKDAVRHYYGSTNFDASAGVTIGVVDTGVGPHYDLNLVGGRNTVTGEPSNQYEDWHNHGTHVAGLIGARGKPPSGLRGMAPDAKIRAYRVFAQGSKEATNYAILKAMIFASSPPDNCDIINLSLGGIPQDAVVEEAIRDAREQGVLVVIAAGNDGRKQVSYPAAYPGATAVSALGREKTFPSGSLPEGDIERPPPSITNPDEFIAGFSNVGTQIAVTAPGVGVLSTLPNNAYGPLSGTSMAAPVAAGAAACLLSQDLSVFKLSRDRQRSDAIEKMLQRACVRRGFGLTYEGYGLPDPSII